jgi:CubicO group peptidase (beta-lactamase class C family)
MFFSIEGRATALAVGLLVLCIIASSAHAQDHSFDSDDDASLHGNARFARSASSHVNNQAIKTLLASATVPDEGMLFAVGRRDSDGVIEPNSGFDLWKHGAINYTDYLRCGSITKTFVTFTLLKSTNLYLSRNIESFGYPREDYRGSNDITVRDILSHVSGIPEFTCFLGFNDTTGQYIPAEYGGLVDIDLGWKGRDLDFAPRTKFSYSNTGFDLAGQLVEQITATNASIWMRRFFQEVAPSLHIDRGNISAADFPNTPTYAAFNYPPDLPRYAGSLVSKARDLIKGLNLMVNTPDVWFRMHDWNYPGATPLWAGGPHNCLYYIGGDRYGLGLQYYDLGSEDNYAVGHEGDIGPRTVVAHQPSTGHIFMLHSTAYQTNDVFIAWFKRLVHLYNNDEHC